MANHLTEFQMNQYFGWIQGSDMPATYVHMSGREVDNAILKMNGIETDEKREETKMLPPICPRCDTINGHDSKFCLKCGGVLNLKSAMELEEKRKVETEKRDGADNMMNLLLRDKEVQEYLMQKLQSYGGSNFSF